MPTLLQALREYVQEHGVRRVQGGRGQGRGSAKIRRLLRLFTSRSAPSRRTARWRCSAAAARTCCDVRAAPRQRGGEAGLGRAAQPLRGAHRQPLRHRQPEPPRRQVAGGYGALDLAREELPASGTRTDGCAARARRGRGDQRVRAQPARPAAGRTGRAARHHGPRPRPAHRREGGGGGCHRQGGRYRRHLSARAEERLGRLAAHAGGAGRKAPRRTDLHRQRHRLARDRQAGARADQAASRN